MIPLQQGIGLSQSTKNPTTIPKQMSRNQNGPLKWVTVLGSNPPTIADNYPVDRAPSTPVQYTEHPLHQLRMGILQLKSCDTV